MLNTFAVSGYRSLREFVVALDRLNLVTGANGSGQSNLYLAVRDDGSFRKDTDETCDPNALVPGSIRRKIQPIYSGMRVAPAPSCVVRRLESSCARS